MSRTRNRILGRISGYDWLPHEDPSIQPNPESNKLLSHQYGEQQPTRNVKRLLWLTIIAITICLVIVNALCQASDRAPHSPRSTYSNTRPHHQHQQTYHHKQTQKRHPTVATQQIPTAITKVDRTNTPFNLWQFSPTRKHQLFSKYKGHSTPSPFIDIAAGKDQEFNNFASSFQQNMEVVNWEALEMTPTQRKQLAHQFKQALAKRSAKIKALRHQYSQKYKAREGIIIEKKKISYKQFLEALDFLSLAGTRFRQQPSLGRIHNKEKEYYRKKYKVGEQSGELGACIVSCTYNNLDQDRYMWHLESILQQNYSNYTLIIIDDASTDQTVNRIANHLKWRNTHHKVVLLKNKHKKTATENFYYAVHKYCDYGQMFMVVDGDDELIGTQVLSLFNALYQQNQYYTLYSSHLYYDPTASNPVQVGISEDYSSEVKEKGSYRQAYHAYSHLRTMLSDLFLLERQSSLQDEEGAFYWSICDNAMYLPALEMSCGRVKYLPELVYWYNANTGLNDRLTLHKQEYQQINRHILQKQSHYQCLDTILGPVQATA